MTKIEAGAPRINRPASEEFFVLGAAFAQAFASLEKCLLNNGALKRGEFSQALKDTLNHSGADRDGADYEILQLLASQLDEAEAKDRKIP